MRNITIFIVLMLTVSCGGRVSRPVSVETNLDSRLSCPHIKGEYTSNEERILDLKDEAIFQSEQNVGIILLGGIFLLDAKDEQGGEIKLLQERNAKLTELAANKSCETLGNS